MMTLFGENPSSAPTVDRFEEFWILYPRKVAKAAALKMWGRLKPDEKQKALDALPAHIDLWKRERRDPDKIPHAASWLNPKDGRRWEDEIQAGGSNGSRKDVSGTNHGRYDRFVRGRDPKTGAAASGRS